MLDTTVEAVKAILKADPTINPDSRTGLIATLRHGGDAQPAPARHGIVKIGEAAALLKCSKRTVASLMASGALKPVVLPGRKRAHAVSRQSVEALIS
jgi:hypothetical protein